MDKAGFFAALAGVGVTGFALLFAAIQFRWREWSSSSLGKISVVSVLFELFTIMVVSLAVSANLVFVDGPLWPVVALLCAGVGYYLTFRHVHAYRDTPKRQRRAGDAEQNVLNFLPLISYGALGIYAGLHMASVISQDTALTAVAIIALWFFISACYEAFFVLSPHMLLPEPVMKSQDEAVWIALRKRTGGAVRAWLLKPDSPPKGGIVVAHEIWGIDRQLLQNAFRLADLGYITLVPDLYAGRRHLWSRWLRASQVLRDRRGPMIDDLLIARDWLQTQPDCRGGVAGVGFSLGGTLLLETAATGWTAVVSAYADLPRDLERLNNACPILAIFGARDSSLPGAAAALHAALAERQVPNDVVEYPDAGHSFMSEGESAPLLLRALTRRRTIAPNHEAAADAWHRIADFLGEHLPDSDSAPQRAQTH